MHKSDWLNHCFLFANGIDLRCPWTRNYFSPLLRPLISLCSLKTVIRWSQVCWSQVDHKICKHAMNEFQLAFSQISSNSAVPEIKVRFRWIINIIFRKSVIWGLELLIRWSFLQTTDWNQRSVKQVNKSLVHRHLRSIVHCLRHGLGKSKLFWFTVNTT